MKAKFIGDPRDGGKDLPDTHEAFGVTFERGKFAEVPDDKAAKFAGNSHFKTEGAMPKAEEAPKVAVAPTVPVIPA